MQKLWAEEAKFTSSWRNFSFITYCIILLCGICHFLGYKSAGIVFMGWAGYSCKFHLSILVNKVSLLINCYIVWK